MEQADASKAFFTNSIFEQQKAKLIRKKKAVIVKLKCQDVIAIIMEAPNQLLDGKWKTHQDCETKKMIALLKGRLPWLAIQ